MAVRFIVPLGVGARRDTGTRYDSCAGKASGNVDLTEHEKGWAPHAVRVPTFFTYDRGAFACEPEVLALGS